MDDTRVPDVVGEVVAWRAWEVVGTVKLPRLKSVSAAGYVGVMGAIWPTNRWFYAECPYGHGHGQIPMQGCSCGLYAAKDREQLVQLAYGAYGGDSKFNAIGQVGFAGKVIEGSQGWKAERGRVLSLILPHEFYRVWGEAVSAAYNVPVEPGFLFGDRERDRVLAEWLAAARRGERDGDR